METPRLLLVPGLSELEWQIKPELEQWAEVVTFDPPGVGDGGDWSPEATAAKALDEVDRRGWERFVLVADASSTFAATQILAVRPEAVAAFALGHAAITNRGDGERPSLNGAVLDGMRALVAQDSANFMRFGLAQLTQDGFGEDLAKEMLDRVSMEAISSFMGMVGTAPLGLEAALRKVKAPLLFAKHEGCLLHTDEGFEDAVAAFPECTSIALAKTCSVDPGFARALRYLCDEVSP